MPAKVLSNLESMGELIGALKGIQQGMDEPEYIEGLIKQAHNRAATAFNVAAAATASAGALTHVYEFGVPGITRGIPKFPDPTDPAARLWVHTLTGTGGNQDIGYSFRPALQRNPQPTTQSTGVPSKYLRKLSQRKYVFWNKALVTEAGTTVNIKPKNGKFLFVPFYGEPSKDPRNHKGFMMWAPTENKAALQVTPGRRTAGSFTKFWMGWWATSGNELIEGDMRASVTADLEKAEREAERAAANAAMKPVEATNLVGASARGRNTLKKIITTYSTKRRGHKTR